MTHSHTRTFLNREQLWIREQLSCPLSHLLVPPWGWWGKAKGGFGLMAQLSGMKMFYELCCLNAWFYFMGLSIWSCFITQFGTNGWETTRTREKDAQNSCLYKNKFLFFLKISVGLTSVSSSWSIRKITPCQKTHMWWDQTRGEFYIQTKFLSSAKLLLVPCTFKFKRWYTGLWCCSDQSTYRWNITVHIIL